MNSIKFAIVACIAVIGISSCSQSHKDQPQDMTPREVKISLGGEFIATSFQPMGRADNDAKYYGINVYQDNIPYAYGVFTSEAKMAVTLTPGKIYKFECTTVKDDKHKIAKINDKGGMLRYPFCVGTKEDEGEGYLLSDLNQFVYSSKEFLTSLKSAKSTIVIGNEDANGYATNYKDEPYHPSQLRFYGELSGYQLTATDNIRIDLKCASFQIGVETTDNEVPDGVITWAEDATYPSIDFSHGSLTPGNITYTATYAFDRPDLCWSLSDDNTSKVFNIKFTWTREGGNTKEGTDKITVKRNTKTVVTLNLEGKDKGLQFVISEEPQFIKDTLNQEVTVK